MTATERRVLAQLPPLLERDWQRRVVDYARLRHWRVYHSRPAQRADGSWSTPLLGHAGFPDLLLCRGPQQGQALGRVIFAELKAERGRVAPEQEAWLAELRETRMVEVYLWRPSHWSEVQAALR